MAEHRPTETLLSLIQENLTQNPQGLAPKAILDLLVQQGEDISRPTLNRLLALGVEQQLWTPQGAGRSVIYTLGAGVIVPSHLLQDTLMAKKEEAPSPVSKKGKKSSNNAPPKPVSVQAQIQSVVWWVADTLRDKTGLQVEAYQPVTLALMALKRNLDIQAEQLREGGDLFQALNVELPLIQGGLREAVDVARTLNTQNGFWNPSLLSGDRFGLPFMTWADLANFQDSDKQGEREEVYTMVLRSNPEGHQTEETALFTYKTRAHDLKALILEIVDSLVPDLREAFGAIGIHNVLGSQSEHAATLSNSVLREICTTIGDGNTKRLADFDLSMKAISTDLFSDTYMDLLGRFAEDSGKKGGEYFTPTPLVENALKFLPIDDLAQNLSQNPSQILKVGDPTAGSNTFLVKFHEAVTSSLKKQDLQDIDARQFAFYAQELKNTQVGLGVFNMFYHGLAQRLNPTETELHLGRRPEQGGIISRINGNSISEYSNKLGQQSGKLDLVLANPPYGTDDYGVVYANSARNHDNDKRWTAGVPTRSEGEWAFVQTIVDLLVPNGQAVIVLPLGVLFRDGGKDFRKYLIEKDWLEGIVATPSNQFLTTSIPVCLMIINKNKKEETKNGVFFINASSDFTKTGKFNHWNEEKAVQAWTNKEEIEHYSGFVSQEKLRKANYTLSVNRFFSPPQEKEEYNPFELMSELEKIQKENKSRNAWLDDVFTQASQVWAQSQALKGSDNE